MNARRLKILTIVYGEKIFEAFTLDSLLDTLSDGLPHSYQAFISTTHIGVWEIGRKTDKLFDDSMVKIHGDSVLITSKGMLHLSKGGYVGEIKAHKRTSFSFWLSVTAIIISIASAIISWFND